MKVMPISTSKSEKTGKKIGTAAGVAGGSTYFYKLAKKEGFPDMFKFNILSEEKIKQVIDAGHKDKLITTKKGFTALLAPKKAIALKVIYRSAIIGAIIAAGTLIGGLIGKAVDKHNAKKAQKA